MIMAASVIFVAYEAYNAPEMLAGEDEAAMLTRLAKMHEKIPCPYCKKNVTPVEHMWDFVCPKCGRNWPRK